ncbi:uncharacterized protein LOC131311439 isoform X2 [Rhododendron vialii]|uniref:uncharacterized protein LOC131311439 isoform X2 n=1 Tax=Rhododendron vialii TaxID=182163 RepID=UPI00265EFA55|nr:uncharacterized protein LOC131311439 isoform X2 [Rhododendron vialii]XP_058194887.1 uncharacterized protein LOC131311439 isoform X2 [Rhododendron vialii]
MSVHSPCKATPSSASSLRKVELEIKLLEALAIYPPAKLQGIHRHFVLYGLMEYLRRSFGRHFSSSDVLQLLDRFYNLEMLVCVVIYVEVSYHLPKDNCNEYGTAYGELRTQNRVETVQFLSVVHVICWCTNVITKFWC